MDTFHLLPEDAYIVLRMKQKQKEENPLKGPSSPIQLDQSYLNNLANV